MLDTDRSTPNTIEEVWSQIATSIQTHLDRTPASYYKYLCRLEFLLLNHQIDNLTADLASTLLPRLLELEKKLVLAIDLPEIVSSLESLNLLVTKLSGESSRTGDRRKY
jgi:hypothetical protein